MDPAEAIAGILIPYTRMPAPVREAAARLDLPVATWAKLAVLPYGGRARVPGGRLVWDSTGVNLAERPASSVHGNAKVRAAVDAVRSLAAGVDKVPPSERAALAGILRSVAEGLERAAE